MQFNTKIKPSATNRYGVRKQVAVNRQSNGWNMKMEAQAFEDKAKKIRAAKVEKRVLRATTRRKEREAAKAKGVPVKYSIK
jgi:hypothetical protein